MSNGFRPINWERVVELERRWEEAARRLSRRIIGRLGLRRGPEDPFDRLLQFVANLPVGARTSLGSLRELDIQRLDDGLDWWVATYEHGRVRRRVNAVGLKFMQYNAALVSDLWIPVLIPPGWEYQQNYLGANRIAAVARWIALLRATGADVIGLDEVYGLSARSGAPYVGYEQEEIATALNDLYPWDAAIPLQHLNPLALSSVARRRIFGDLEADLWVGSDYMPPSPAGHTLGAWPRPSELLLLANRQFESHWIIYTDAFGADEFAAKGVIQARMRMPTETQYDLFLTHVQDPNASGDRARALPALTGQVSELAGFIDTARRSHIVGPPGDRPPPPPPFLEVKPALLMGDLNIDGNNGTTAPAAAGATPVTAAATLPVLGPVRDLWTTPGVSTSIPDDPVTPLVDESAVRTTGITSDTAKAFARGATAIPIVSSMRHTTGARIDQFLVFDGVYPVSYLTRARVVFPQFYGTTVLMWELTDASGIDLSDHYGLATTLGSEEVFWVEPFGPGEGDDVVRTPVPTGVTPPPR